MERRSVLGVKLGAVQRYMFWHYLSDLTQNIHVTEFPKSGGTWFCQMLGELTGLPFPRNKMLPLQRCIHHSHYPGPSKKKSFLIVRDGRDVMVSAYFHFLIPGSEKNNALIQKWQRKMGPRDFTDVKKNLPSFIEVFSSTCKIGGKVTSWADHILSFKNSTDKLMMIRYEELLTRPAEKMEEALSWIGHFHHHDVVRVVDKFEFKKQSNRDQGTEDRSSFLRKGISGDWKNYFTGEAEDVFYRFHLEGIKYLGYA